MPSTGTKQNSIQGTVNRKYDRFRNTAETGFIVFDWDESEGKTRYLAFFVQEAVGLKLRKKSSNCFSYYCKKDFIPITLTLIFSETSPHCELLVKIAVLPPMKQIFVFPTLSTKSKYKNINFHVFILAFFIYFKNCSPG